VFSALFLAATLLLVAPLAAYLPIRRWQRSCSGSVGLDRLSPYPFHFPHQSAETAVLITTLLSTLFVELEFAIYVGVMLSLMLYLARTSSQPS